MRKKKRPRLSDQFREHVRNSGMLPIEIAGHLGINRSVLSKFLNGEQQFLRAETMDKLAELLDLELTKRS